MATHPTDAELRAYSRGELPNVAAESVAKHLGGCDSCKSRAADLSSGSQSGSPGAAPKPTGLSGVPVAVPRKPSPASPPPAELLSLKQYSGLQELGRGGMGVVYLAKHIPMARMEVLKVVQRSNLERVGKGAVERFLREIQAAARLQHPNVVAAYTVHTPGDLLVFAMEYAPGADLAKVVRNKGPLPVPVACSYIVAAALGLQHAHEANMVHRDIKPSNLIVTKIKNKTSIKILDFGLAKVISGDDAGNDLTRDGSMMGTPDYMAPEQAVDAARADIRADVYSLGCTLYFLLTGRAPFSGGTALQVIDKHRFSEPKPLCEVQPAVPPELAAVVAKMLAKNPAERYQTPAEVARAVRPFVSQPAVRPQPASASFATIDMPASHSGFSQPEPDFERPGKPAPKRGGLIALIVGGAIAALVAVGVGGAWIGGAFAKKPVEMVGPVPVPMPVPIPPGFVPPLIAPPPPPGMRSSTTPQTQPRGNELLTPGTIWRGELTTNSSRGREISQVYRLTITARNDNTFEGTAVRELPPSTPYPIDGRLGGTMITFAQNNTPPGGGRRGIGNVNGDSMRISVYGEDGGTCGGTLKLANADSVPPLRPAPPSPPGATRPPPTATAESVPAIGPTAASEAAVDRGLAWLANQQRPDGSWLYDGLGSDDITGATAMALLPFLAAGQTHKSSLPQAKVVGAGLDYLRTNQLPSGRFANTNKGGKYSMLAHARATLSLCEALGMTNDPLLVRPTQSAVNLITAAQAPDGSWGDAPGEPGTTSLVGWQIQALAAAKQCPALRVDPTSFARATKFLDSVASGTGGSRYGSTKPFNTSHESSATGLYCREILSNWTAANEGLAAGLSELIQRYPPRDYRNDTEYYHFATLAIHAAGGEFWTGWNPPLRQMLVARQDTTGPPTQRGSWPADPIAYQTGRLGATCLSLLALEVEYRQLPLNKRDAKLRAALGDVAGTSPNGDFKPLFTTDLTGWTQTGLDSVEWTNSGGTVTAVSKGQSVTPDSGSTLITNRSDYGEFALKFEIKLVRNFYAKVGFRRQADTGKFRSYDIVLNGNGSTGDGKGFSRTGNLFIYQKGANYMQVAAEPTPNSVSVGEWFPVEIVVRGDRIKVLVDGQSVLDHTVRKWDAERGAIAFSYGFDAPMSLRNVRIHELGQAGATLKPPQIKSPARADADKPFEPLFNGKDILNWATHREFNGTWQVEGKALVGHGVSTNGAAMLDTDRKDFKDFHLKAVVQNQDGKSPFLDIRSSRQSIMNLEGACYRIALGGTDGFGKPTTRGSIWRLAENNRQGPDPTLKAKPSPGKPSERYTLEVIAEGNRIRVLVDGHEVTDYTDPSPAARSGRIALICLSNSGVRFESIGIRD